MFGELTLRLWEWSFEDGEAHLLSQRVGLIDSDGAATPLSQLSLTAPLKGSLFLWGCGAGREAPPGGGAGRVAD